MLPTPSELYPAHAIDAGDFLRTVYGRAWFLRLFFANDTLDLLRRVALETIRMVAGRQLVQHNAQPVDVAGGVTAAPRTCSGLAYLGVIKRSAGLRRVV